MYAGCSKGWDYWYVIPFGHGWVDVNLGAFAGLTTICIAQQIMYFLWCYPMNRYYCYFSLPFPLCMSRLWLTSLLHLDSSSLVWLSLYCVFEMGSVVIMVRDHMEVSLWSKTSLWQQASDFLNHVSLWIYESSSGWSYLDAKFYLNLSDILSLLLSWSIILCFTETDWVSSRPCCFLSFFILCSHFESGLLCQGSFYGYYVISLALLCTKGLFFLCKGFFPTLSSMRSCPLCIFTTPFGMACWLELCCPILLKSWQPNLMIFVAQYWNGFTLVSCWLVIIVEYCLRRWLLSDSAAPYAFLPSLFSLISGVHSYFWSAPSPFLFFLELLCWVWRSVFQQLGLSFSSPGSNHGFLPLVWCWDDFIFFELWLSLGLSVTSWCQLGQPKPKACLAMACDVPMFVELCSEATLCSSPLLPGCYWHLTCCCIRVLLRLLLPFYFCCPDFIFGFFLPFGGLSGTQLYCTRVRDVLELDFFFSLWLDLCDVLLIWTDRDEAALHSFDESLLFRSLLSSPFFWILPRLVGVQQEMFVAQLLQQHTPFRSFLFFLLNCIIIGSSWNKFICNKLFCMFFRIRWGDMYVSFRLISMYITALYGISHIVMERYGLPFFSFLLSLSMVRGHKANVLWPVASPLNLLSGPYSSCMLSHMVRTNLVLLWYDHHDLLPIVSCGWYLVSFLSLLNLTIRSHMATKQVDDVLTDVILKHRSLNDSFQLLRPILEQTYSIFYQ